MDSFFLFGQSLKMSVLHSPKRCKHKVLCPIPSLFGQLANALPIVVCPRRTSWSEADTRAPAFEPSFVFSPDNLIDSTAAGIGI
jgi:hypothetical protein